MNKIVTSLEHDPYYNLALEEELFNNVREDEVIFYLWQNEKTVVIGRNQNPWLECDIDTLKKEGGTLARRLSGGGAVFHDLGNLNFTFITRRRQKDLEKQLKVIKDALKSLGIECETSGRNDLTINRRKFSGHAFYETGDRYFHHGTLMVDVDLEFLGKILKPSKIKLESKGITSVKSRVINIKECLNDIDMDDLKTALIKSFTNLYGDIDEKVDFKKEKYIPKEYYKYSSTEWIYGESPNFDVKLEEKLPIGNVQVLLKVKDGVIEDIQCYSDSLEDLNFESFKAMWKGKSASNLTGDICKGILGK
jgi:lipoate-protein ligase A